MGITDSIIMDILGVAFSASDGIEDRVSFTMKETTRPKDYQILKPYFELRISVDARVGERIRAVLDSNNFVISQRAHTPRGDPGWMIWEAVLRFRVAGNPETDEGFKIRNESIGFVWRRLGNDITRAVLGNAPEVRSNVRPVTNIANLIN